MMGSNDAREQLAAAQAECIRLERELAAAQATIESLSAPGGDDPIPRYAQCDIWQALYGTDASNDYDRFRDEHGFAETWARLCSEIRTRRPSPVTREALANWLGQYRAQVTEHPIWVADWDAADDFLSRFSVPEPAEVEWEYQCQLSGNPWTDVDADHRCSGIRRRRRKAGDWVPVKGTEQ